MVLLAEPYCGSSNRLFQNAHLEAFCLRHGIRYFNPSLADIAGHYAYRRSYPLRRAKVFWLGVRALKKLGLVRPFEFSDEARNPEYQALLKRNRGVLFVKGWAFRDYEGTKLYREKFAARFAPLAMSRTAAAILEQMSSAPCALGVHIRRGDYATWEGGKYLYPDAAYLEFVDRFRHLVNTPITVVVFSDGALDKNLFSLPDCRFVFSEQPFYVDHVIMSRCHYIIGPPSTFSMWASYIGKTKYLHATAKDQRFGLGDFRICDG